jgi:hypothetical protein
MPLSAKRVLGTFRYAMYFDGIDDRIVIPLSSSLNFTQPTTLEIWLAVDGFGSGSYPGVVRNNPKFNIFVNVSVYNISPRVYSVPPFEPIAKDSANMYIWTWRYTYVWNTFFHAVLTYDGSVGKMYINGSLFRSNTISTTMQSPTESMYIGYNSTYFKGRIYRVSYYNRVLSDDEIIKMYKDPYSVPADGLRLWLQAHPDNVRDIDNDGILEWIDLSGNNNHGKIYGATLTKVVKDAITVSPSKRILSVIR